MAKSWSNKHVEQNDAVTNTFLTTPTSEVKTKSNLLEKSSTTLPKRGGTIKCVDEKCFVNVANDNT